MPIRNDLIAGRYQLLEQLGSGAMGVVWTARDLRFESRVVALKILREDEASSATAGDSALADDARLRAKVRRLFRDEANSVADLRHENIVSISDYGDHLGVPFLAMDYIEGHTLSRIIDRHHDISRSRRLRWIEDLCSGLGHAHQKNLVHRDIKPANLVIDAVTDRLKVLDFGVVRRLERPDESTAGGPVGTFCYMSPEQTRRSGAVDQRSDVFAVGAVFYELLSGQKAFPPGDSVVELVARIQQENPRPLLDLIPDLEAEISCIVERALNKDPALRYPALSGMRREIESIRIKIELVESQADRTRSIRDNPITIDNLPHFSNNTTPAARRAGLNAVGGRAGAVLAVVAVGLSAYLLLPKSPATVGPLPLPAAVQQTRTIPIETTVPPELRTIPPSSAQEVGPQRTQRLKDSQKSAATQRSPGTLIFPGSTADPTAESQPPAPIGNAARPVTEPQPVRHRVPIGTPMRVRITSMLRTDLARPGDEFSGRLDEPVVIDGRNLISSESDVSGRVEQVTDARTTRGRAALELGLTTLRVEGVLVAIRSAFYRLVAPEQAQGRPHVLAILAGASVGAAIGALSDASGAASGASASAGRPPEAVYPLGNILTFKLAQEIVIALVER